MNGALFCFCLVMESRHFIFKIQNVVFQRKENVCFLCFPNAIYGFCLFICLEHAEGLLTGVKINDPCQPFRFCFPALSRGTSAPLDNLRRLAPDGAPWILDRAPCALCCDYLPVITASLMTIWANARSIYQMVPEVV